MNNLELLRGWLGESGYQGIIVPSTDEYTSEFAPPANRRLQWACGFSGSTGAAVVTAAAAGVFLDTRYALQGSEEVVEGCAVIDASAASMQAWLHANLAPGERLAIVPALHSLLDIEAWRRTAGEIGVALAELHNHPIDALWNDRPAPFHPDVIDYPLAYAGRDALDKCRDAVAYLSGAGLDAMLLADPEDIAWLLNVRAAPASVASAVGDWHVVPAVPSRVIIERDGAITWFVDRETIAEDVLNRLQPLVRIVPPGTLAAALERLGSGAAVGANPRRTPADIARAIRDGGGDLRSDERIARWRWTKHPAEVDCAKDIHRIDAVAVVRFLAWLDALGDASAVTEHDAAQKLEEFRQVDPRYLGPSMPLMSAAGPNCAKPHYVPRAQGSLRLADHAIYWMDSGGQYRGGSTDNTVTVALRAPGPRHVAAHTAVLRGWMALSRQRFPRGTNGLKLDSIARLALWNEGLDYGHNTGHGVGNCLNIHEGPLIGREPGPTSLLPLEPGMIVANEPAYYAPGDFGVRVESHMAIVSAGADFLAFETISRLPLDPKLIDFARLSLEERIWLADYHRRIVTDLDPLLDGASRTWLARAASAFAARSA